jgi:hypothetical protein
VVTFNKIFSIYVTMDGRFGFRLVNIVYASEIVQKSSESCGGSIYVLYMNVR